jgi:pimeloyl-ACP methyl ester carboxylesterase
MNAEPALPRRDRFPVGDGRVVAVPATGGVMLRAIDRTPPATDPSLPPVLLIHGLASNARMWDGVGAALARQGIRSVAVDLRGHGLSDKPDTGYDFDTVSDDLVQVLDHFDWPRAIFVGQSWGGNVVVHSAHRNAERVVGSVPVDGGMIELGRLFTEWDECARALRPPNLLGTRSGRMEAAIRSMHSDWPESGIIGALSNFEVLDDGTVRPWLRLEHHMLILRELWQHRPTDLYPHLDRPILWIPADSGDVAWTRNKDRAIDDALSTLPRARVHWFRPAHHDVHAQHPERVAEVIASNMRNGFLT